MLYISLPLPLPPYRLDCQSMENLGLQGNVRARTQDVAAKSIDCVLSVGALDRIGRQAQAALVGTSHARYPSMVNQRSAKLETIKEAYR